MNKHFMKHISGIPVQDIIEKYCNDRVCIEEEGSYVKINPCPKCGHNDCCKVNLDNNTLACWSERKYYLNPLKVMDWLFALDTRDATIKLAEDFDVPLPDDFEEYLGEYIKEKRKQDLVMRFAEECHKLMTPEDYQYWQEQRGLTEEIINKYLIGVCPGDGRIYNLLLQEGFTADELEQSNLFKGTNEHFCSWRGGRCYSYYTLPNWNKGVIIDIQGRFRGDDYKVFEFPKYKNLPGRVEQLYNPEALDLLEDTVFLAEGIPDALSLMQMGFNATCSYGVGGVKDEWLYIFKKKKAVYIIFDSDDAGRNSAFELARKIGEPAKIINLPEVKDVNELLAKYDTEKGKEVIEGLMQEAKTALEISIGSLPDKFEQVDSDAMKDIAFSILDLPPYKQEYYRQLLVEHCNCPKRVIEDTIRFYKEEWSAAREAQSSNGDSPEVESIVFKADPMLVRLGQCFALNKVFYAQEFIVDTVSGDTKYQKFATRVITSDREVLLPPTPKTKDSREIVSWDVGNEKLLLRRPLINATRRWSKNGTPFSIDVFLAGKEKEVLTVTLFKRIRGIFRRYFYTPEKYDHDILALFTMFTYYFELYDAVPYIYLNGPAESGKTTVSILLQNLAFNGDLVSNISTSSLFRECEQKQPVLILDEQEDISNNKAHEEKGDYMAIVKDAYKRTGTIKRQSTKDYAITEEFQVYNPLVIANVKGLESILKSRVIQITTRKAPNREISGITPLKQSDPEFIKEVQLIRDMLYCWVMQKHEDLRELPNLKVSDAVSNRAEELFQPILALATYIEVSDETNKLQLVSQLNKCLPSKLMKRSAHRTKDPVELLRESCLQALADENVTKSGQAVWVPSITIFDKLVEINGQHQGYMTLQWIGDKITSAGWILSDRDKQRRIFRTVKRDKKTNLPLNGQLEETEERKCQHYFLRYDLLKGEDDAS